MAELEVLTRDQVLKAFRERNPNFSKYNDDQIMTIIGQEAPNIIRHLVVAGDKDAAKFTASNEQVVQNVQNKPNDISRLVPNGKELMQGYQPGPNRASLNSNNPVLPVKPPVSPSIPIKPAQIGMGDVQTNDKRPIVQPKNNNAPVNDKMKKYRITNPDTNETFVISMNHQPTDEEIDHISQLRAQTKKQQESSLKQAGINVVPPPPEPKSNLPENAFPWEEPINNLGLKLNSFARKYAEPVQQAGVALMGGVAPGFALPIIGKNIGEQGYKTLKDPSVANIAELAKHFGYALMAGMGEPGESPSSPTKQITTSAGPKLLSQGNQNTLPFNTGEVNQGLDLPEQGPIAQPASNILAGQPKQITSQSEVPTVKSPLQIPARTQAGNPVRGQGFTVNAPKVVRPTTEGVYEVPETKPLTNKTDKLEYGGGEGSRLATKPTGFQTIKVNPPKETGTVEQVDEVPIETKNVTPEKPIKNQKVKIVKQEVKPQEVTQKPPTKEIENKWLRETDDSVLKSMRPGASGQLADEIDSVINERGLNSQNQETTTNPKEENPNFNEQAFNEYNELLGDLPSHGKGVGHIVLRDIASKGKEAGLDQETIANDLMENIHPEVTNPTNKAWNATNKIFNPED